MNCRRYTVTRCTGSTAWASGSCQKIGKLEKKCAFQTAVVKSLGGDELNLNCVENMSVRNLRNDEKGDFEEVSTKHASNFERIEAKWRRLKTTSTQYIDFRLISATSSSVKQTFSVAKWVLTTLRKKMSPILFESLFVLKLNRNLSDMKLVSQTM